jgi:hypothetical protein
MRSHDDASGLARARLPGRIEAIVDDAVEASQSHAAAAA